MNKFKIAMIVAAMLPLGSMAQPESEPAAFNCAYVGSIQSATISGSGMQGWQNCEVANDNENYYGIRANGGVGSGGMEFASSCDISAMSTPYLVMNIWASAADDIMISLTKAYTGDWSAKYEWKQTLSLVSGWNTVKIAINDMLKEADDEFSKASINQVNIKEIDNGVQLWVPKTNTVRFYDALPVAPEISRTNRKVIYSTRYNNEGMYVWSSGKYPKLTPWGNGATVEEVNYLGGTDGFTKTDVAHATNFNWFGLEVKRWDNADVDATVDVSGYDHIHFDYYTTTSGTFRMTPITNDGTTKCDMSQKAGSNDVTVQATNKWCGADIDLTMEPFASANGFDLSYLSQIAFNYGGGSREIYIDNIYMYKNRSTQTHDDNDGNGIDWSKTNCYYKNIVWQKYNDTAHSNPDGYASVTHDLNNLNFFETGPNAMNGNEHVQWLMELKDDIVVSDVELIWSNGFPKNYSVYAFDSYPVDNGNVDLSTGTKLFEITDKILTYEPYFETQSNLQEKKSTTSRYLLVDMTARGETDIFGYKLAEAHVGAYDDSYDTPHHLGIPDYVIVTETEQELDVTVRNERNAIINGYTVNKTALKTSWTSPQLKKLNNSETTVLATSTGTYYVNITGEAVRANGDIIALNGAENTGVGKITVNKNWIENGAVESLVQIAYNNNTGNLASVFKASYTQNGYNPWLAGDSKEADDDISSRWSSFHGWYDYESAETRKTNNSNQYWMVDLGQEYEITNMEIIWERAYAPEYKVFGFITEPSAENLNKSYQEFSDDYTANELVYEGTNEVEKVKMYPLHDEHTTLSASGAIRENNRTRYLVIKMNEPAPQSGDFYGFSLWEVYAWGADHTITDNVDKLKADNTSVKAGQEQPLNVTAFKEGDEENYSEDNWFPVSFGVSEDGFSVYSEKVTDKETGTELERFYIYRGSGATSKPFDDVLVATITDNDNGTYGIVANSRGWNQSNGLYDTESGTFKSFTITMSSTNTLDAPINGEFELVIYKEPMQLLTDGTSTNERQVYDNGYFSADVLRNNANAATVSIDLRNVDFTTDNAGNALGNVTIAAPHTIKSNNGTQLNPNTIIYTDETSISGGNLAMKQADGTWLVQTLRIFDGWDWSPITTEGGLIAENAMFYTSLKAGYYSFLCLPFVPDPETLSSKDVTLYKPTKYYASRQAVKIDELTSADFSSGFEGKPYIVSTTNENLYKANGYGVAFKSNGRVSVPYFPQVTKLGDATIIPTYTRKNLSDIANGDTQNDYFLYSIKYDQFLEFGNGKLAEDFYNSDEATLSTTEVMPFYSYITLPKGNGSAKVTALGFTFEDFIEEDIADDSNDDSNIGGEDAGETISDIVETGIAGISALMEQGRVKVYDMQGRLVSNLLGAQPSQGFFIIKANNGTTKKVYIRK